VVLDGTTTMIGRNGMFNWRNKLTVSILPPVSAERVAAADPKELMEQVRASMCVRLAEIRKQK
jgi:1-acyl-sn-glycerol-3-phosphate acyltransferase